MRLARGRLALANIISALVFFVALGDASCGAVVREASLASAHGASSTVAVRATAGPGSFVSLSPGCGCGGGTVDIDRFSLVTGAKIGIIARLRVPYVTAVWPPHRFGAHHYLMVVSHPAVCTAQSLTGTEGCEPTPNTCAGRVETINTTNQRTATMWKEPRTAWLVDAVPSPDDRALAMVYGPCDDTGPKYLAVQSLTGGHGFKDGVATHRCGEVPYVAWSRDGSKLVFPSVPRASGPDADCGADSLAADDGLGVRLSVVPALRPSGSASWAQIRAGAGCGFQSATFDREGIVAVESCGLEQGITSSSTYLLQYDERYREVLRLSLPPAFGQGSVVDDPQANAVLVSENQISNVGASSGWVWTFRGRTLTLVHRYQMPNAYPQIFAEP
jgi:hypothetical protein